MIINYEAEEVMRQKLEIAVEKKKELEEKLRYKRERNQKALLMMLHRMANKQGLFKLEGG